jgi:hypothetical protein
MRLATALVLTGLVAGAATLYAPSAHAGVYIGIGIPAPVIAAPVVAPPLVAAVPAPPAYYPYPPVYYAGIGYRFPGYWAHGHYWGYRGYYGHPGYAYHGGWAYHRH